MEALWSRMARAWPIVAPTPVLVDQLGETVVSALEDLRLLVGEPLRPGCRFPCDGCVRGRRVVASEGLWAVCCREPAQCDDVEVTSAELLALDDRALTLTLRDLLGLDGPFEPLRWDRVALVGERRFGSERVVFGLAPRPRCVRPGRLARWIVRQSARVTVLLAPSREARPTLTPTMPGQVLWLSLEGLVDLREGVADLSELAMRLSLSGAELGELLWPRFALVLDPSGDHAFWGGKPLRVDRSPRVAALLRVLAERSMEWVSRRDLMLAVYPDEITNRGRLLTDPVKLERRLRQLVSDLGKVFRDSRVEGLPDNPIENLRARSDVEGGYRLALPPERVFIQSGGA